MKKHYEPADMITILRGGNPQQIEIVIAFLYKSFKPAVASYINQQGGTYDDAKDIFQEVILFFYHQVYALKFEAKSFKEMEGYFIKVAHYKWLKKKESDKRRGNRENDFLLDNDTVSEIQLPPNQIVTDELSQEFSRIIEQLGERCKCILKAYYVENLSIKEISEMYDFGNHESVKVQKFRCLQKLKEKMKKN